MDWLFDFIETFRNLHYTIRMKSKSILGSVVLAGTQHCTQPREKTPLSFCVSRNWHNLRPVSKASFPTILSSVSTDVRPVGRISISGRVKKVSQGYNSGLTNQLFQVTAGITETLLPFTTSLYILRNILWPTNYICVFVYFL